MTFVSSVRLCWYVAQACNYSDIAASMQLYCYLASATIYHVYYALKGILASELSLELY